MDENIAIYRPFREQIFTIEHISGNAQPDLTIHPYNYCLYKLPNKPW